MGYFTSPRSAVHPTSATTAAQKSANDRWWRGGTADSTVVKKEKIGHQTHWIDRYPSRQRPILDTHFGHLAAFMLGKSVLGLVCISSKGNKRPVHGFFNDIGSALQQWNQTSIDHVMDMAAFRQTKRLVVRLEIFVHISCFARGCPRARCASFPAILLLPASCAPARRRNAYCTDVRQRSRKAVQSCSFLNYRPSSLVSVS